jgi:hypothetical protein
MWDRLFAPLTAPTVPWERPTDISGLWWQQPQIPLTQIVIDDIFGDITDLVDRGNAMKVPAVTRARDLLVGSIADLPLVAYRGDDRLTVQPTWAYRTDVVTPWHRMAFTIDDLLFYDCSLWLRQNDADGFLLNAARVPIESWAVDGEGRILIEDKPVDAADVIYFPGPTGGGLLQNGRDTIRGARAIDRAWVARTRSPIPPTLFQQTQEETATRAEIDELLSGWARARTNPDTAGVGFVPWGITPVFPAASDDSAMFIQGRNAIRLDIANLTNIPASLLDGSTATASLTYVTADGQRSSFQEQTLRYWTAPIEHRLSMDDVVPRGQRVRFDITYETQVAPTGEPGED